MSHWRELIDTDWLGVWDLKGKEWTLRIKEVRSEQLFNPEAKKKKRKMAIFFEGAEKGWIAGPVSGKAIEGMYGPDPRGWVGKDITLYPTTSDAFGKRNVPCVRVKNVIPKGKPVQVMPSQPVDPAVRAIQNDAARPDGREPGEEG